MAAEELSAGQALYLPIYSKIWHGDRVVNGQHPIDSLLSALVSIRNTSLKTPVRIVSARYYSTEGKLLKEYLTKPAVINAMGTLELFVERKEAEGGSGPTSSFNGMPLQQPTRPWSRRFMPIFAADSKR